MSLREYLRVLVVVDMAVSRGLLTQALDQLRIQHYRNVADGEAAMEFLKVHPMHLVISDYDMPGMGGLGLLQAIRSNADTAKLGFIMITGSEDANVIQKGAALGMNTYLRKPLDAVSLQNCIEKIFGRL